MALRTPLTAQPHLYIGDSTGRPLDYGKVYFGEPNKDPELYPIDIYLDPEMTIAAAQPVRTKGGFMDVGGNLAELHAAEVIYSLKVLDQYGRQVFYKPEMYRNNVSDFLVDEITRATAAETLISGNLTAETQRAIAAEKVIADAVVTEKDRAVAAEVALDAKHAALSSTINSLGGGKKAYTTYALMVADKNNIAANSSIDVTNDTDPLKNGTYSYDGAVFAKSIYDIEAIVRAKVLNTFKTKALMDASALPDGADAQVTDDTVNHGLYVKTAGAWVKSDYDPINQAKSYADATVKSTKTALENSINSKASFLEGDGAPLHAFTDKTGGIVAEIDSNARVVAEDFICGEASLVEISKQTFKVADSNYTHIFADANGDILLGIKKDATLETATGTIGGVSTVGYGVADMRAGYLDSESMNEVGLALDAQSLSKTPIKLLIDVASVGDDETVMQRMPNAVKITDSRFFVLFTQFSTAMDDARNGRLVGRFVDFDVNTGSSTVSATVPIAGEKIGSLDRHPVVIQLRDKVVVIYNNKDNLPVQIESYDGCQTWISKGVISVLDSPLRMVTLNGAVQINSGKYVGRIVLAVQTGGKPTVRRFGVWYSDDGCETWQAGFTEVSDIFTGIEYVNEISLALDSQQNMLMAFRSIESAASKRNVIFGKVFDGGHQFEPIGMNPLVDTSWSVFGFAQTAPNLEDGVPRMILSHPASRDTTRRKFRVRVSYDNCQSFVSEYAPLDDTEYAGYSSVIPINNDTFAVVFETGYHGDSANIKLLVVNLSEIM